MLDASVSPAHESRVVPESTAQKQTSPLKFSTTMEPESEQQDHGKSENISQSTIRAGNSSLGRFDVTSAPEIESDAEFLESDEDDDDDDDVEVINNQSKEQDAASGSCTGTELDQFTDGECEAPEEDENHQLEDQDDEYDGCGLSEEYSDCVDRSLRLLENCRPLLYSQFERLIAAHPCDPYFISRLLDLLINFQDSPSRQQLLFLLEESICAELNRKHSKIVDNASAERVQHKTDAYIPRNEKTNESSPYSRPQNEQVHQDHKQDRIFYGNAPDTEEIVRGRSEAKKFLTPEYKNELRYDAVDREGAREECQSCREVYEKLLVKGKSIAKNQKMYYDVDDRVKLCQLGDAISGDEYSAADSQEESLQLEKKATSKNNPAWGSSAGKDYAKFQDQERSLVDIISDLQEEKTALRESALVELVASIVGKARVFEKAHLGVVLVSVLHITAKSLANAVLPHRIFATTLESLLAKFEGKEANHAAFRSIAFDVVAICRIWMPNPNANASSDSLCTVCSPGSQELLVRGKACFDKEAGDEKKARSLENVSLQLERDLHDLRRMQEKLTKNLRDLEVEKHGLIRARGRRAVVG